MAPPALTTIAPTTVVTSGQDMYFGKNFSIQNSTSKGVNLGNLQLVNNSTISTTSLNVNNQSGNSKLTINSTGDINTSGYINTDSTLEVTGATILKSTLAVTNTVNIGNGHVIMNPSGEVTTVFTNYIAPASASDTISILTSNLATTSSTSQDLVTQTYVDNQIWNQTARINAILSGTHENLDNFKKVYELVSQITGDSSTVDVLTNIQTSYGTLETITGAIETNMSEIVAYAYNTVLVNCTQSIWADECQPLPIPYTVPLVEDGWYFKNLNVGNKINWYLPTNGPNMTIGSIQNMYLNMYAVNSVSMPFIVIYTKGKPSPAINKWGGAVNASICYTFGSTSATSNTGYCLHTNSIPINVYNKTLLGYNGITTRNSTNWSDPNPNILQTIDSTMVSPDDKIFAISIQSNSGAAVGNAEFVIQSLNIQLKTGTTQFLFQNSSVITQYLMNSLYQKNSDLSPFPNPSFAAKQNGYLQSYISANNL